MANTNQTPAPAVHPTRPLRHGFSAIKGTATGLLDGMAKYGRTGLWAGVGLGLFVGIMTGAVVSTVAMMAIGGFVLGAGAGAAFGAISGGYNAASREARRDKYADEIAERNTMREARAARTQSNVYTHRDTLAASREANNRNFERALQQERENDRDYGSWADRVSGSGNGYGRGY